MNCAVSQLRQGIINSIELNKETIELYNQKMKLDPFDESGTTYVPDSTGGYVPARAISCRIIRQGIIEPAQIPTGIGTITGDYIITDYTEQIIEGQRFNYGIIGYRIGPVVEVKFMNEIIGYKAPIYREQKL